MEQKDSIGAYFDFVKERPELFTQSSSIPLVLDEERMRDFSRLSGRPMGIVYHNRGFYRVVADLCKKKNGTEFSYARVIYEQPTNGAVALPYRGGCFGLLRNFRHSCREELLELPRGFAKKGLTPEENIREELYEEMNAEVTGLVKLGTVRADTGLAAGYADVFLAEVASARAQVGHEGIRELVWLEEKELYRLIASGEITDGFTLSALSLYRAWKESK